MKIKEIDIPIGIKFTQVNLEFFVSKYWDDSFKAEGVNFDLSNTEWVSSEEITFLFSWMRRLKKNNVNVKIQLPFTERGLGDIDEIALGRRRFLKYYLLSVWGMFRTGIALPQFENISGFSEFAKQKGIFNYGKKIIPFKVIDTKYNQKKDTVDTNYEIIKAKEGGLFTIEEEIINLLNENDCYSPFENKVISDIITKELVINSMEHSGVNESYFTTALKDKWEKPNTSYFIDHFIKEKELGTIDFYRDKNTLKKKITKEINAFSRARKEKLGKEYYPNLSSYEIFKNQSFLEFTYLDFGKGIPNTLKKEYKERIIEEIIVLKKIEDKGEIESLNSKKVDELISIIKGEEKEGSRFLNSFSNNIFEETLDTQILEYAFLMESSKEPFDREDNPYYYLIPRGLYFVIDMVRRYKGLLVARSGYGKVIYDFSNRIKIVKRGDDSFGVITERIYVAKDSIIKTKDSNKAFFQGTMLSIILPQRKTQEFKRSSVRSDDYELNKVVFNRDDPDYFPAEIFKPESYEYLNLAFEYKVAETKIPISKFNTKLGIDNIIFSSISNKLKDLSNKNCLLFIDFDFIPVKNNNNILKILLYLSNNPMINERLKVVVTNLKDEDLIKLKEYEQLVFGAEREDEKENDVNDDVPFLFKPIPCIQLAKTDIQSIEIKKIQWIGVRKKEDVKILTDLFFGNIEPTSGIPLYKTDDDWAYEGNVVTKHIDRAYSIFTDIDDLVKKANHSKISQLEDWLIEEIKDGDVDVKPDEEPYYFLTSKGSYQKKYLSLYETLNYKYAAQYFAQYLLEKYINQFISNHVDYKHLTFYDLRDEEKLIILKEIKFDKMIVVTVSSQLLGIQIRDLIKENKDFRFLLKNRVEKPKISDCPKIIKLSSYFSFDSEKPFEEIEPNNKILIVNDVISTGSLVERLITGIEEKKASVTGILTIVDSRKPNAKPDTNPDIEFLSSDFKEHEGKVVSITSYTKNKNFGFTKLKKRPERVINIKRINPILNSVVTLKSEHTEKSKILFEDPKDLIFQDPFQKNIFKIGHFEQNISHNSYFTNMHNLFSSKNGEDLLKIVYERILEISDTLKISVVDGIKNKLLNIKSQSKNLLINEDKIEKVEMTFDSFIKDLDKALLDETTITQDYLPEFIFHPVFSGIEEVSDDTFHEIFKTDKTYIISLQRYDTINGWRFPFPAKRYNKKTQGAHILIIDSGSLSGHSLTQLVDSLSFLDVGRIDFLSIVGRVDDFQREFHSRLRSIKVKNLKSENGDSKGLEDSIVNLNILFGINLHIPTFLSKATCPFCQEISQLKRYKANNKRIPKETIDYIDHRIEKEINIIEDTDSTDFPIYLPFVEETELPDYNHIFLMRDKLGKVDSYRFYVDYFEYFDDLSDKVYSDNNEELINNLFKEENKESLKEFEQILICLLHEPKLLGVLKDLLSGIYHIINSIVSSVISKERSISGLNYVWSNYAFLRLKVIFDFNKKSEYKGIYDPKDFQDLFEFSDDDILALNYLSFLLSKEWYNFEELEYSDMVSIEPILEHLDKQIPKNKKNNIRKIINHFRKDYRSTRVKSLDNALENLKAFFTKTSAENSHSELTNKLSITNAAKNKNFTSIDDFYYRDNILTALRDSIKILKSSVYDNLQKMIEERLTYENCYKTEFKILFDEEESSVYSDLSQIMKTYNSNSDHYENNSDELPQFNMLLNNLSDFESKYLAFDNNNSFYAFSDGYFCNLKECLINARDSMLYKKQDNLQINFNNKETNHYVKAHKVFLVKAFKEIFDNVNSYTIERNKEKKFQVVLDINCLMVNNNYISLSFIQNTSFDKRSKRQSGTKDIIEKVLKLFCEENFKIDYNSDFYTIQMKFKQIKENTHE